MSLQAFGVPLRGSPIAVVAVTDALSKALPAGCSVWSPPGWDLGFPDQIDDICAIDLLDEQDRSETDNVALLTQAIEAVDPDGDVIIVAKDAPGAWSRINDRLFARPRPTPEHIIPALSCPIEGSFGRKSDEL
jgi:hypothetical protein